MKKTMKNSNTKIEHVRKLAKKAGFVIWTDCEWAGNRVGKVDWSCDYDIELTKFYDIVRKEVLKELGSS
jgi:hypothetical protein